MADSEDKEFEEVKEKSGKWIKEGDEEARERGNVRE